MRLRLYYHSPPCVISHPAHNLPCVYQQTRTNRSDRRRTARVTILAGYYYWDIPIALKKSEKATTGITRRACRGRPTHLRSAFDEKNKKHAPAKSGSGPAAGFSSFWPKKFIAGVFCEFACAACWGKSSIPGSSKEGGRSHNCNLQLATCTRSWPRPGRRGASGGEEEDGRGPASQESRIYLLSVLWFLAITNRLLLIPTYMEGRQVLLRRRYTSTRYHRRKDTDGAFRGALNHAKNVRVKRRLAARRTTTPTKTTLSRGDRSDWQQNNTVNNNWCATTGE